MDPSSSSTPQSSACQCILRPVVPTAKWWLIRPPGLVQTGQLSAKEERLYLFCQQGELSRKPPAEVLLNHIDLNCTMCPWVSHLLVEGTEMAPLTGARALFLSHLRGVCVGVGIQIELGLTVINNSPNSSVWGFPPTHPRNSSIVAGCPIIQLSSDTVIDVRNIQICREV